MKELKKSCKYQERIMKINVPCSIKFIHLILDNIEEISEAKKIPNYDRRILLKEIEDKLLDITLYKTEDEEAGYIELVLIEAEKNFKIIIKEENVIKYLMDTSYLKHKRKCSTKNKREGINLEKAKAVISVDNNFSYIIRRMYPEEALEISKCVYEAYVDTYAYKEMYYPRILEKLNKDEKLLSYVAISLDGEIMAHVALRIEEHNGEMLAAFTKPKYRKMKCLENISVCLIKEAEKRGIEGVYVDAVSTHVYSQKSAHRLDMSDCAIKLSSTQSLNFKGLSDGKNNRENLFICYKYLQRPDILNFYAPEKYRKIIKEIYSGLRVRVNFLKSKQSITYEETDITIRFTKNDSSLIYINKYGRNILKEIETKTKQLSLENINTVYLYLEMENPMTQIIVKDFERMGYLFCGIMPGIKSNKLILQHINSYVNYDEIKADSELGKNLLSYIKYYDVTNRDTDIRKLKPINYF